MFYNQYGKHQVKIVSDCLEKSISNKFGYANIHFCNAIKPEQ